LAPGAGTIAVRSRRDLTNRELQGESTVIRAVDERDAELLAAWHDDPEVARYWDDERFTREEMRERLRRPQVEAFVVEADEQPIGYMQVWAKGDGGGIDMFLVPGARGRGLGPDAARTVARHLRDARGWRRVTVDPYVWNAGAIRAWRRAGFRDVDVHEPDEEHTARWLLMEFVD
jgi:aminoglycoside 6'-N-acetyltransferase